MSKRFKFYVEEEVIYSGNLSEVPDSFRETIIEDLSEWAGSLGKRGLNELMYSHLAWYKKKGKYCDTCQRWFEDDEVCLRCGAVLEERYVYERNQSLDMLMTCIGMITRIEVVN